MVVVEVAVVAAVVVVVAAVVAAAAAAVNRRQAGWRPAAQLHRRLQHWQHLPRHFVWRSARKNMSITVYPFFFLFLSLQSPSLLLSFSVFKNTETND